MVRLKKQLFLLGLPVAAFACVMSFTGCAGSPAPIVDQPQGAVAFCATDSPTPAEAAAVEIQLASRGGGGSGTTQINIPVYVHVITGGAGEGNILDSTIATQMNVLNNAYAGTQSPGGFNTPFRFTLVSVDRTANSVWFTCERDSADEVAMKTALRRGSADDLNLYIRDLPAGLMGYGGFPWWYASNPAMDGPTLDYTGMPGGADAQFNLGDLAVHEIGHWAGLYHTFEGGCTTTGDYVSDTPAQARYNWSCPTGTIDTCTGAGFKGADPTMNFMDYTTDSCKWQFTKEQSARMSNAWATYRAGK
ncbi:MAG: zinc metalloprotease [Fimbriimonas sp.]